MRPNDELERAGTVSEGRLIAAEIRTICAVLLTGIVVVGVGVSYWWIVKSELASRAGAHSDNFGARIVAAAGVWTVLLGSIVGFVLFPDGELGRAVGRGFRTARVFSRLVLVLSVMSVALLVCCGQEVIARFR